MNKINLKEFALIYLLAQHTQKQKDGIALLETNPWNYAPSPLLYEEIKEQHQFFKKNLPALSQYFGTVHQEHKKFKLMGTDN